MTEKDRTAIRSEIAYVDELCERVGRQLRIARECRFPDLVNRIERDLEAARSWRKAIARTVEGEVA